jgi:DNA-binding transcriptional ArsR family regulator
MVTTKQERQQHRRRMRPHPARDQIVDVMRSYGKPISPTQLSRITGGSIGATAYHVRTLVDAGVVELADEGRVRGAVEHFYILTPGDGSEIQLVDPIRQLLSICGALTVPDPDGGYPCRSALDDAAREYLEGILSQLRPEVQRVVAESTGRIRRPRRP